MSEKMTLSKAQQRLDEILDIMNDGSQPFDKLLKYYEEASELLTFCYKEININKGKFEQLKDKLEQEIAANGELNDE